MSKVTYYQSRLKTYYETVKVVAAKNLKIRYKNSVLGYLWTLITPLFLLMIFTFVFSHVISKIPNYIIYVTSGLIFWNFFISTSNQIIVKIQESGNVLKSINVPPIIFPLSSLVSNFINFLLSLAPFIGIIIYFGYRPDWNALFIIPALLLFIVFTFGFSLTLSCMNVYFRDVEMFWTTITPALFYATPVVYVAPPEIARIMMFNPFAYFINMFHDIIYYGVTPSLNSWLICFGLSVFAALFGLFVYQKLRKGFISNF
jgi:ABC-2 type transport system permease protein